MLTVGGVTPFEDQVLTTLDPRTFPNGGYTLELSGMDISGRSSSTQTRIDMNTPDKTGVTRTQIDASVSAIAGHGSGVRIVGTTGATWFGNIRSQERGKVLDPNGAVGEPSLEVDRWRRVEEDVDGDVDGTVAQAGEALQRTV